MMKAATAGTRRPLVAEPLFMKASALFYSAPLRGGDVGGCAGPLRRVQISDTRRRDQVERS